MTERSAEQAPVQTRPDHQDTARIPLAERLQRRISAADERRAIEPGPEELGRVLPPPPPELTAQRRARGGRPARRRAQPARAPGRARRQAARRGRLTDDAVDPDPGPVAPAPVREPRAYDAARRPSRGPRRARLRLSRIDPWSVMKVSFLLSIAFGIVTVVSVFMVWSVLGAAGVWSSINNTVSDTVSSGNNTSTFNIEDYLGMSRVLGFTMLVSVIDVILITAIATLGAFLYNMAASLLGGIEVTLAEDQA